MSFATICFPAHITYARQTQIFGILTSKHSMCLTVGSWSPLSSDEDEDEDPWMFRGKSRRWMSMLICTIACSLASGPVAAFPTLEPLLQAEGLFTSNGETKEETEYLYNVAYTVASAGMFLVSLPAGMIYDVCGGRAAGVYGALLTMMGLFFMYLSVAFPQNLGWVFFLGYPIATGSGFINQNSLYTFMWLLPENANLINGIAMGAQALSDMLALIAVWLNDEYDVPISYSLLGLCALNVVAAVMLQVFVPTKRYYLEIGRKLMVTTTGELPPIVEESSLSKVYRSVEEGCKRPVLITLMMVFSSVYFLSTVIPLEYMLYYYEDLWPSVLPTTPSTIVTYLVNTYAIVYGLGGFVSSVFGGALCDEMGIRYFTLCVGLCAFLSSVLLWVRNENVQIAAEIVMTFGANLYGIVVIRYSVLYAPPDLFGCLSGTLYTLLTFGMLAGYIILAVIMNVLDVRSQLENYRLQFLILGIASVILSLALVEYWKTFPPPDVKMDSDPTGQIDEDMTSKDIELPLTTSRNPNESTELLHNQQNSSNLHVPVSYDDCHIFTSP